MRFISSDFPGIEIFPRNGVPAAFQPRNINSPNRTPLMEARRANMARVEPDEDEETIRQEPPRQAVTASPQAKPEPADEPEPTAEGGDFLKMQGRSVAPEPQRVTASPQAKPEPADEPEPTAEGGNFLKMQGRSVPEPQPVTASPAPVATVKTAGEEMPAEPAGFWQQHKTAIIITAVVLAIAIGGWLYYKPKKKKRGRK